VSGLSRAPLALLLGPLLWAAVRFGPAGVGLSMFAIVVLAVEGNALFPGIRPEDQARVLQIFLIGTALPLLCVAGLIEERQNAVEALRVSHLLKSGILASIPNLVALVSRNGRIVTVNESWSRHVSEAGMRPEMIEPGASFPDLLTVTAGAGSDHIVAASHGVQAVLDGSVRRFALDYPSDPVGLDRWWTMSVVPLENPEGGAVVTHTDITARKRAEVAAQQNRDELAHVTRVWAMGELTASLSHQLNQPLTAILGNAQVGVRLLDGAGRSSLRELRHILTDIIADGERAADVTRTVREMLRKGGSERPLVDVNEVVRATVSLVGGEAKVRNVRLDLALGSALPLVRAEPVQLQQVVLNLAVNAIEAVGSGNHRQRVVTLSTEAQGTAGVAVSVRDTGAGLPEGGEDQIFEPLFTTKASGMGMGLSIARAIVETHGGTLSARTLPAGGAIFQLILPLSAEQETTLWPGAQG
jgi:signal transduction histidine kinase